MIPKKIGDGRKANKLISVKPNPKATGLSFSSTHLKVKVKLYYVHILMVFILPHCN